MTSGKRKWLEASEVKAIRQKVSSILQRAGCKVAPVPIERIAAHLGATIRYGPYPDGDLAGMLIRAERPIIAINSAHHKNRQRFTIAHECGHLVLHQEKYHIDKSFPVFFNRDKTSSLAIDRLEVEANQFAAEMLMPFSFLIRDVKNSDLDFENGESTRELARKYHVSEQAMNYRLANIFLY
jgi:Zn-dependent peptidase ImmA (M78 family)